MEFPKKPLVVDHINGNGLDNQRENLRVVSSRINRKNNVLTLNNGEVFKYRPKHRVLSLATNQEFYDDLNGLVESLDMEMSIFLKMVLFEYLEKNYPHIMKKHSTITQ
jgi:flagellar basal body rod protein FlgC